METLILKVMEIKYKKFPLQLELRKMAKNKKSL